MSPFIRSITAGALMLSLASCSFSSPTKQNLRVVCNDPAATIELNGEVIGKGEAVAQVSTAEGVSIVAKSGSKRGFASVDPTLSKAGIYDIVGGCFLLVPFIGLASDGAWKLEQDTVQVNLK